MNDHAIAGLEQAEQGMADGGHAAAHGDRGGPALEAAHLLLEGLDGGVPHADVEAVDGIRLIKRERGGVGLSPLWMIRVEKSASSSTAANS